MRRARTICVLPIRFAVPTLGQTSPPPPPPLDTCTGAMGTIVYDHVSGSPRWPAWRCIASRMSIFEGAPPRRFYGNRTLPYVYRKHAYKAYYLSAQVVNFSPWCRRVVDRIVRFRRTVGRWSF